MLKTDFDVKMYYYIINNILYYILLKMYTIRLIEN